MPTLFLQRSRHLARFCFFFNKIYFLMLQTSFITSFFDAVLSFLLATPLTLLLNGLHAIKSNYNPHTLCEVMIYALSLSSNLLVLFHFAFTASLKWQFLAESRDSALIKQNCNLPIKMASYYRVPKLDKAA